jgi:cell wall assembly regulator SMI1
VRGIASRSSLIDEAELLKYDHVLVVTGMSMRIMQVRRDSGQAEEDAIVDFERTMGIRFPKSYRELLLAHDAPRLQHPDFKFVDRSTGLVTKRDVTFFGFGASLSRSNRIVDAQDSDGGWQDHLVVFGTCANGDHVCFDYRDNPATDEPAVALMFHDFPDCDGKLLVNLVAESFDEFLELLHRAP